MPQDSRKLLHTWTCWRVLYIFISFFVYHVFNSQSYFPVFIIIPIYRCITIPKIIQKYLHVSSLKIKEKVNSMIIKWISNCHSSMGSFKYNYFARYHPPHPKLKKKSWKLIMKLFQKARLKCTRKWYQNLLT